MNDEAANDEAAELDDRAREKREDEELAEGAEEAEGEEQDIAEKPGSSKTAHEHADRLADEWGEESFPGSDPPAHY